MRKKLGPTLLSSSVVLSCALIWAVLSVILLGLPVAYILKFFAFQGLCVILPGLALTKLLRLRQTPLEAMVTVYGLGIAVLIVIYFCFAPFYLMQAIPYALIAAVAVSAIGLFMMRSRHLSSSPDTGETAIALVFCCFAALATFIMLSLATVDPLLSGTRFYFHDTLNGVALTTSASRGWPMHILQMSGTDHWYHIFFFSYNAMFKIASGIPSFEIVTRMSLITLSPFIAALLIALLRRIVKKNLLLWLGGLFCLVLPSGATMHYLYQDVIGYPMGLAFALLSVLFFHQAESADSGRLNRHHLLSVLFLLLCVGAKGPVAVSIAFGMGICLVISLFRDKRWAAIPIGLIYTLSFVAIYFFLYRSGAGDSMSWSPLYSALRTPFAETIRNALGKTSALVPILCAIEYTIASEPVVFLCVIVMLARLKKLKREKVLLPTLCLSGVFIGWFLMNTFKQMGSSELYFLSIMTLFVYLCALQILEDWLPYLTFKRITAWVLILLFVPLLCLNAYKAGHSFYGYPNNYDMGLKAALEHSRFSPRIVTEQQLALLDSNESARRAAITPQEYEAYVWLRENTPEDAVIADGRYTRNNKFFYGTAISERAFFLEGFGFVTMEDSNDNTDEKVRRDTFLRFFFSSGDEGYLLLMAREGCDYIMISEYINPGLRLSDQYCTPVFENEHVRIYLLNSYVL